jgi:glycosyltransferase involved in cell wall biosynthesis
MAAGTPVMTSSRSGLLEVAGDAALLVDPMRTESLVEGLRKLAHNEDLRKDLALRGRARAALFAWDKAVRETWEIYRQLLPAP